MNDLRRRDYAYFCIHQCLQRSLDGTSMSLLFCKRSKIYDNMIECEGCSTWFCVYVGLRSSSNTDNWKCPTCM